jgi:hypothetical protein
MRSFIQQNYLNLKKSFMTSLNWGLGTGDWEEEEVFPIPSF